MSVLSTGCPILLISTIATVIFAHQPLAEFQVAAKLTHLIGVFICAALLFLVAGHRAFWFLGVTAILFAFGILSGLRLPYVVFLNVLFLSAGMVLSNSCRELAAKTITAVSLASGAMMLLQLLGVGEWTQILATHGIIDSAVQVSKVPYPTLFVDDNVQATFLQGRPSGLLHSNQFASFVTLFAISLRLGSISRNALIDFSLAFCAVLTLSKIVFLGVTVMALVGLTSTATRRQSAAFLVYMLISTCLYAVLFPGVFRTMFNLQIFIASSALRLADLLSQAFGERAPLVSSLLRLVESYLGDIKLTARMETSLQTDGGKLSAIAALKPHAPMLIANAAVLIVLACVNRGSRRVARLLFVNWNIQHLMVFSAMLTFSLSANFLNSIVFWLFAGFSLPTLKGLNSARSSD